MRLSSEKQKGIEIVEEGLLDSGATEKFIDQNYARRKGLKMKLLKTPIKVYNVDGTPNKRTCPSHHLSHICGHDPITSRQLICIKYTKIPYPSICPFNISDLKKIYPSLIYLISYLSSTVYAHCPPPPSTKNKLYLKIDFHISARQCPVNAAHCHQR